MVAVCGSSELDQELLERTRLGSIKPSPDKPASRTTPSLRDQLATYERRIIARTLAAAAGNRSRAAKLLGLSRTALFDRLKKYELATGWTTQRREAGAMPRRQFEGFPSATAHHARGTASRRLRSPPRRPVRGSIRNQLS